MATPEEITVPVHAELHSVSGLPGEAEKPAEHVVCHDDDGSPGVVTYLLPEGWHAHQVDLDPIIDGEDRPRRPRGTVTVEAADDLVELVNLRRLVDYEPVLYGNEQAHQLVAVLNDPQHNLSAWGDYRVVAQLRRTPEWQAWLDGQGFHTQQAFAEFIEDHLEDITTPPAADMLELAQTFHAHTAARFKSASMLQSGRVSLLYDEDQTVSAGGDGKIDIPREFEIAVRPFVGTARVIVRARLRYRVGRGELALGWALNRPDEIERAVFSEQLDAAAEALEVTAVRGCPTVHR